MKLLKVTKKDIKFIAIVIVFSVIAIALAILLKADVLQMNEEFLFSKNFSIWALLILGSISLILAIVEIIVYKKQNK